jgi:hypothetical protein
VFPFQNAIVICGDKGEYSFHDSRYVRGFHISESFRILFLMISELMFHKLLSLILHMSCQNISVKVQGNWAYSPDLALRNFHFFVAVKALIGERV